MNKLTIITAVAAVILSVSIGAQTAHSTAGDDAAAIMKVANVKGGLIVHVGCGDGKLTAALRQSDSFIVHGLDRTAANVEKARQEIRSQGLADMISISRRTEDRIPFVDNTVNLLVWDDDWWPAGSEIERVLAPGGAIVLKQGDKYIATRMRIPEEIDQWTHYLHGPDNNAVSSDKRVAPPQHMQFRTEIEWSRLHHKLASVSGVVTADGRLFYVMDAGPGANLKIPAKWSIVARDAYNGTFLWRRPIESWTSHQRGFRAGPVQMPRLLVTDGQRVYVPLCIGEPLVALDSATGETVVTYAGTKGTEEIIIAGGTLLAVAGSPSPTQAEGLPGASRTTTRRIMAFNAADGKPLWKTDDLNPANLVGCTLAADATQVYYQSGRGEVCLDLKTGKEVWRTAEPDAAAAKAAKPAAKEKKKPAADKPGKRDDEKEKKKPKRPKKKPTGGGITSGASTLVVKDGVVLSLRRSNLKALSAEDGKELWSGGGGAGFRSPGDVFVIDGLVWTGKNFSTGRDLKTGEVKRTTSALSAIQSAGHHHRCYRNKATERYVLAGHRGIEFLDLVGDDHCRNNWVRGLCQYGVMPANGFMYAPPHSCGCYMEAKLYGFWALAAARENWKLDAKADTLEQGPAYGSPAAKPGSEEDQWPTLRKDARRSGVTAMQLPNKPADVWQVKLGTRLSAPVAAAGMVLAADIDSGTIHAVDAATGEKKWSYATGSRVDSPPTIYQGYAIFGGRDGYVYCLRLADGQLAWRRRLAPADLRTVDMDRVESLWPVCGSVMVQNDLVYCCAGRNTHLDDGLFLFALDPDTGNVVHQQRFHSESPKIYDEEEAARLRLKFPGKGISQNKADYRTFAASDKSDSFSMDGNTNDVVSGDGQHVFLRHMTFDGKWQRADQRVVHLFSTSHLTDGNENHRSHWCIGKGFFGRTVYAYPWIPERFGKSLNFPIGVMLAYKDRQAWGVRRTASGAGSYTLFCKDIPDLADDDPAYKNDLIRTGGDWKWGVNPGMRPRSMLVAGDAVVLGGMPLADGPEAFPAFEGKKDGLLKVFSASDGTAGAQVKLDSAVVWDGMAAAEGKLFVCTMNGSLVCVGK